MGRVTPEELYSILWAANTYSGSQDPGPEINNYLINNAQWTPNIRTDSGQPDAWRDYQQAVSELGLMFSRKVVPLITPTPLGLAFLDGSLGFSELITLQALRFQYPNGHHVQIEREQKEDLSGTPFATAPSNVELQVIAGVKLRPAVLVWRVLRGLAARGQSAELTVDDIERYLLLCATHADTETCLDAIISARGGGIELPRFGSRQRRNVQDWIKFLGFSPIFDVRDDRNPAVGVATFGLEHATEIDAMCDALERPETFWEPSSPLRKADRLRWYAHFGGVDLSLPQLPEVDAQAPSRTRDYMGGREEEEDLDEAVAPTEAGQINLRPLEFTDDRAVGGRTTGTTIELAYSAELTVSQHRLHDQMVLLIGRKCKERGADVYADPGSVDLLVRFRATEFIVEVKSVTPKNFIARLRYALGQVLHYDYLRSVQATEPRRKVIALAAKLPPTSWSIPFVKDYLDMDLLSLDAGTLRLHSRSSVSNQLFA